MPRTLRSWLLDTSSCVGDPACLLQPTDQSILLHALPFAATFFLPPRPTGQPLPVSFGWRCNELGQRPSTIELYTSPDGAAYDLHATIHGAAEPDGVLHACQYPSARGSQHVFFALSCCLMGRRATRDAPPRWSSPRLRSFLMMRDGATLLSPPPHADSHPKPHPPTVSSAPSALPTFGLPPLPPPQPRPPPPHPPPRPPPVTSAQWPPAQWPPLPARTLPPPWDGGTECSLQLVQHTVHNATLLAALQRQVRARPIGASWRLGPRGGHAHHTHASTAHTRTHARLAPTRAR